MTNSNFPEIETERLSLKRLEKTDWEQVSFLRSDENVNEFVDRPSAATKEKALAFIERINGRVDGQSSYYWKITESSEDKMIGSICLWNFSEDAAKAEIGYDLHPDYQGKGIMNEALVRITEFGFQTLKLNLIEAYTHSQNERSRRLLERNGFKLVAGKKDADNQNNVIYELKSSH